jgi:hypothetical protein
MSTTYEEIAQEIALAKLIDEAKIERAKKEQCIYLFVEGDSEEIAFPLLLNKIIDLAELGVIIANYNGIGNLNAALRLLSTTLSHDRPVIVTYDNDLDGKRAVQKYSMSSYFVPIVKLFPIPQIEVVNYPNDHKGGSFEESFLWEDFVNCAFQEDLLPNEILAKKDLFINTFDQKKPWYDQLKKYCALNGFHKFGINKLILAEKLALECKKIPQTYIDLADLISEVRNDYPIIHPDNVDLPDIPGLTC